MPLTFFITGVMRGIALSMAVNFAICAYQTRRRRSSSDLEIRIGICLGAGAFTFMFLLLPL